MNEFKRIKQVLEGLDNFRPSNTLVTEEERLDPYPFTKTSYGNELLTQSEQELDAEPYDFQNVFFIDGVQKTVLLGDYLGLPIFLHLSSAAVLQRDDKRIVSYGEPIIQTAIITHNETPISDGDLKIVKVSPVNEFTYYEESSKLRKTIEQELFKKISKVLGFDDVLIFDGPLMHTEAIKKGAKVIGVIKRHSTKYLENPADMFNLPINHISKVFKLERGKGTVELKVASFYLRLYQKKDPLYGLIRVEIPFGLVNGLEELKKYAGFIMKERFPISGSLHQGDKKLYPIKVCEHYLNSKLPNLNLIKTYLNNSF